MTEVLSGNLSYIKTNPPLKKKMIIYAILISGFEFYYNVEFFEVKE